MDKNPRQITRLRVEDQKKIEELATKVVYNKDTNTTEVGSDLKINGDLYSTTYIYGYLYSIEMDDSSGIYFEKKTQDDGLINAVLDLSDENIDTQTILTDKNTKTVFGKSIRKDPEQPEDNIDLYRHSLEIKTVDNNTYLMTFNASSNLKIASLQDLTTVLKPASGSLWFGGVCFGNQSASMLLYRGNVWCIGTTITDVSNVKTIVDTVTPL